jgi:mannitol 2-dehydrogenase
MDSTAAELTQSALAQLDAALKAPRYDRSVLTPSIVHIGVGGFHRAHLAVYVDQLCRAGHTDWSIVGSGVMPGDAAMASALAPQDHLFTVVERSEKGHDATIVGSMVDYIHAHPDAQALIDAIAAPQTQIVSMTVTEGGYPVDDATGQFDPDSPNAAPGSAFATIIAGLTKRMHDGAGPVTVMSCDNVMGNGDVASLATKAMAAAANPDLAGWIDANVTFPNSMVDRITPATTDADRQWFADNVGIADNWPVVCEPFIQWVIEDNYAGARPPWEELDIIITEDVRPFEHMKLQLLNAGHSLLGFSAHLFEIELVHDGMADPDVLAFVRAYLDREAKTSLHPVEGMDFDAYIEILLERFANPQVRDQILRLAMDGTSRIPKFVLPTLRTHLANGGPTELAALFLATWCQALLAVSDAGNRIEVGPDPMLEQAQAAARASQENPAAFLELEPTFDGIRDNAEFVAQFEAALNAVRSNGLRPTLQAAVSA